MDMKTKVNWVVNNSHGFTWDYIVLGECNYSYLVKSELFCVKDKACSLFNEYMTLSPFMNSHTTSLLPKRQAPYAYKCVRVIVLWYRKGDWDQLYSTSFECVDDHLIQNEFS